MAAAKKEYKKYKDCLEDPPIFLAIEDPNPLPIASTSPFIKSVTVPSTNLPYRVKYQADLMDRVSEHWKGLLREDVEIHKDIPPESELESSLKAVDRETRRARRQEQVLELDISEVSSRLQTAVVCLLEEVKEMPFDRVVSSVSSDHAVKVDRGITLSGRVVVLWEDKRPNVMTKYSQEIPAEIARGRYNSPIIQSQYRNGTSILYKVMKVFLGTNCCNSIVFDNSWLIGQCPVPIEVAKAPPDLPTNQIGLSCSEATFS
jgi:hypothetical protein